MKTLVLKRIAYFCLVTILLSSCDYQPETIKKKLDISSLRELVKSREEATIYVNGILKDQEILIKMSDSKRLLIQEQADMLKSEYSIGNTRSHLKNTLS
jgi:hypothetical protein